MDAPKSTDEHIELINALTSEAVLDSDPAKAAAQRAILDRILAIMEHHRFRIRHKAEGLYPKDYVIRMMEAIVAKAAGYEDRANWSFIENAVRTDLGITY